MENAPVHYQNWFPTSPILSRLVLSLALVGCIGFIAIGTSGLLAELFGRVFGEDFVAGDGPGVTYTAERCADFLRYFPNAVSCNAAAAAHHYGEVVEYR